MKKCKSCLVEKPLNDFYKDKRSGIPRGRCKSCCSKDGKAYNTKNKPQRAALSRKYYHKHKGKINTRRLSEAHKSKALNAFLKRTYGITYEYKSSILKNQNNACAICSTPESQLKKSLNIDHCHKTGIVRGLLCYNCNRALGLFKDNPNALFLACVYLLKPRKVETSRLCEKLKK